jgi:hypothetical protein
MDQDYSKLFWFESGAWVNTLKDNFNKLRSTVEEQHIFNDLVRDMRNHIPLPSYTPRDYLRDVKKIEEKLEEVERRLGLL